MPSRKAEICHLSAPAKHAGIPRSAFAYPECWKYPVDSAAHTRSAEGRFTQFGNRIPEPARSEVRARIERARQRFGFAPNQEKTTMARRATPAQLRALAKAQTARGNRKAATALRARAAQEEGGRGRSRKASRGHARNPAKKAAARRITIHAAGTGMTTRRKAARRAPAATVAVTYTPRKATRRAPARAAARPLARRPRAAARRKPVATRRRRDARRVQCVAVPVRRRRDGRFKGAFMENPVFADNFFDNPEIFADNPARGRGRGHHGGRKSKSATTSAKRRAAARKAAATRKRNRRGGATRRSSGANVRIRIRDNPEFYDNPEFFENPQIDWMSIGLGVGFAAGSYVLIDLLDRYIATMGKTAPWYGPDAAARILERPSGTRIAVQALVGLAGIGGAWYFGNRGSQKASAILAGIGGGALTHLTVQLLTTWAMPSLLKATTGETTDTSLGNRLYPEYQAGSQAKLKAWTDAENTTGVSDSQIAMNFPWIKGGTVAGIDQEQTGVGAVTRQLSAPQPSMWPASYREPVASRPYQPTAAYAAGVAGVASADGSVGGCSSCGKSTRRMPPQSGPGVQGWNGLTAGPGGGMGNWPYPPAGGGCGCQNCQAAALNADALALAAGGGYVGDINAMHRGGWTGGGWPNSMWDVGHGDHCGCQVCAQKRSQLRVAPAARQTTGPGPCVSVETMSSPRAIHEVRMPDVEQHVQPAAPPPVRVKQGCVKVVVHETPEAAVEMAACDAAESAQVYGSPNYGSPPPMAAPIATAAAMAANQAASNAAAAAAVADAAAANASRPTIARMGTAGIPTGPSMRDLMARPQDRSLKGARNRQANLARGTRKQRTSQ